jgi:hypothetical protein
MATPVVLIHFGNHPYVWRCLKETLRNNVNNVYLIGDDTNIKSCEDLGVKHVHVKSLPESEGRRLFSERFVNYSSNSEGFEKKCFLRWYFMLEFMNKFGYERVVHTDSDVALLCDTTAFDGMENANIVVPDSPYNPFRMSNSIHVALCTRAYIEAYIELCHNVYVDGSAFHMIADKVTYHKENTGGVCDMTLTYLLNRKRSDVTNLLKPDGEGRVFMQHMNTSEGDLSKTQYHMHGNGLLAIYKRNNTYYIYDLLRDCYAPLQCLHFQGNAKRLMMSTDLSALSYEPFI